MVNGARGLLVLLVVLACGEKEQLELSVDLRTDYLAGVEFTGARVVVADADRQVDHLARPGGYLEGVRIGEMSGLRPNERRWIAVELVDAEATVVARREVLVRHDTDLAVTVTMSRGCAGVVCPLAEGDTRVSCLGGRCVEPECLEGDEPECDDPECSASADCTATVGCAAASCRAGVCLSEDSGSCAPDGYCDLVSGCVPFEEPEPEPILCAGGVTLDETFVVAPELALARSSSQTYGGAAVARAPGLWVAFVSNAVDVDDDGSFDTRYYATRIGCDGAQAAAVLLEPEATTGSGTLLLGDGAEGLLAVWDGDQSALLDPDTGAVLARDTMFQTLVAGGGAFDGSSRIRALFDDPDGGFSAAGVRTPATGAPTLFVQRLSARGEPTGPAAEVASVPGLARQPPTEWTRDATGAAAVAYALESPDRRVLQTPDGTELELSGMDIRVPSLVVVGDDLWLAASDGVPFEQRLYLGAVRDGSLRTVAIDPPPADAVDLYPRLFAADGSSFVLFWTRAFGTPDEPGYDEVIHFRRVDVSLAGDATLGAIRTLPVDGGSFTGGTDDRNENVVIADAVHLADGLFFVTWDEGWGRFRTFARFVQM